VPSPRYTDHKVSCKIRIFSKTEAPGKFYHRHIHNIEVYAYLRGYNLPDNMGLSEKAIFQDSLKNLTLRKRSSNYY